MLAYPYLIYYCSYRSQSPKRPSIFRKHMAGTEAAMFDCRIRHTPTRVTVITMVLDTI